MNNIDEAELQQHENDAAEEYTRRNESSKEYVFELTEWDNEN
jgi:hypothetical protein